MRTLIIALVLVLSPGLAWAAGDAKENRTFEKSWEGPTGTFDRASMQRGLAIYKQVCSACHGMGMLSYRNLGERGGPFQAVAGKNWEQRGEEPKLGNPGHGKYLIDPNQNPFVRAFAAEFTVSELNPQTGEMEDRPALPKDRFRYPYPNEAAGRLANMGAYPPDLSVITKARHGGADYLYSLLTGYPKEGAPLPPGVKPVEGRHYNPYFKGGWIAMADPLANAQPVGEGGEPMLVDGKPITKEQMAIDVTTFLTWASDPRMEERKQMAFPVLGYLLIVSLLLYFAYREVWKNKH